MARGAAEYNEGMIPAAGSGNILLFLAMLETEITAYQSNGVDAWELADEIDTGINFEKVFHSVGDRTLGSGGNIGDTDLWLYLNMSSADDLQIRAAQDYSPTTGVWATGNYHEAGNANAMTNISDTQQIDWWRVSNEYEFTFIVVQGGIYRIFGFGAPLRPYSSEINGVARITSVSGTGNNVTVGLDRDITASIKATQKVWMLNQTPDATALQSVGNDLVTVNSIGASSANVDGVVGTYAVGSLFGMDPAAMYVRTGSSISIYFVSNFDGSYVGVSSQSAQPVTMISHLDTDSDSDPDIYGLYHGYRVPLKMASVPAVMRGTFEHYRCWTLGSQADADVMVIEYDSAQRWKCFITAIVCLTGTCCGIGPGAP